MKGQRKKAMWAKKRVENAAKRETERKENTARKPRKRKEFVELKPRTSRFVITEEMARTQNAPSAVCTTKPTRPGSGLIRPAMDKEEYDRREALAAAEIARKKKQVAPMWN